jgi:hypothetical protein
MAQETPRSLGQVVEEKVYAQHAEKNLIRWNEDTPGSLIWMDSQAESLLVVNHAFWEICNGKTTSFWNDSWQQLPALAQDSLADTFLVPATQAGLTTVADYWKENTPGATWRSWKSTRGDLHIAEHVDLQPWYNLINARKIQILQGEDILRWGHSSRGIFNIQEAYAIKADHNHNPHEKVWTKIWSNKHWPKISTFLWLVAHGSILTWDNLMKRGFTGPSICPLCLKEVETKIICSISAPIAPKSGINALQSCARQIASERASGKSLKNGRM